MTLLLATFLLASPLLADAQAGDSCRIGNKTGYAFLVDTYNGSNRTGGNRLLGARTSPSMSFSKGQQLRARPSGSHTQTFAGTCSADVMYVVEQGGSVVLVPG